MVKLFSLFLILTLAIPFLNAQTGNEGIPGKTQAGLPMPPGEVADGQSLPAPETPEQQMQRMLNAFTTTSFRKGYLIVSFTDDTTKEQALAVLQKYQLRFITQTVCSETVDPDETPQRGPCMTTDSWQDNLHSATITIPAGKEAYYAEHLVEREERIIWAEPDVLVSTAGNDIPSPDQQRSTPSFLATIFKPFLSFFQRIFA